MVKLAIKRPKKNIINYTSYGTSRVVASNENGWIKGTTNGNSTTDNYIELYGSQKLGIFNTFKVEPNKTYTYSATFKSDGVCPLKLRVVAIRADGTVNTEFLGASYTGTTEQRVSLTPFTVPSDCIGILVRVQYHTPTQGVTGWSKDWQIEEGSVATAYESYFSINKSATLRPSSVTLTNDFIGKIGNGYTTDFNGKKINTVVSDLVGKVAGSFIENPNYSGYNASVSILNPNQFVQDAFTNYSALTSLNGSLQVGSKNQSGFIGQQLFSFNTIDILERQFGVSVWNGKTLLSEKVEIAKQIISSFNVDWSGYGSSPTGNKASIGAWYQGAWSGTRPSHTNGTVTKISYTSIPANIQNFIGTDNGWIHVIAYAEASDGITASTINTDYIQLQLTVSGIENPNVSKAQPSNALLSPSSFTSELTQARYDLIKSLDSTTTNGNASTNTNGYIAQQLFSFDVINMLERTYGSSIWNGQTTLAGKITIAKSLVTSIKVDYYGFGSSVGGNKASISAWRPDNSTWTGLVATGASVPTLLTYTFGDGNRINSDGFIHYLAYAEASDGVTSSVINTDYILLTVNTNITNNNNNSSIAYNKWGTSLEAPSTTNKSEYQQVTYDRIKLLDSSLQTYNTGAVNGQIAQQMFSFNIIDILEKQLGVSIWGGKTLLSDKIAITKSIVAKISFNWYGFGTSVGGSGSDIKVWNGTLWFGSSGTANSSVTLVNRVEDISGLLQSDGFVHYLASTKVASDGVTPSVINTDYVQILLTVNTNLTGHKQAVLKPKTVTINSDYWGKISGSILDNPNKAKGYTNVNGTTLQSPSSPNWWEYPQSGYTRFSILDNSNDNVTTSVNGGIAQQLFSFDIVSIIERYFGIAVWGGKTLLSEKVEIAKQIISKSVISWNGYGSSVGGNGATLKVWGTDNNSWNYNYSHNNGTVSNITHTDTQWFINRIDNGFYHVLVYATNPSNGTIASIINTDYISINLTVNSPFPAQDVSIKYPKKNLFDGQLELGAVSVSTGNLYSDVNCIRPVNFIPVNSSKVYILKNYDRLPSALGKYFIVAFYDINKNFISGATWNNVDNASFTTPANCYFIKFRYENGGITTDRMQLEEGNVSTAYEPYILQNKTAY